MGKGKGTVTHESSSDAFQRINFLYQASMNLMACTDNTAVPAFLANLSLQIAQKVVSKVHPDIKRSLCKACSNPLTDGPYGCTTKLVHLKKKRKKNPKKKHDSSDKNPGLKRKIGIASTNKQDKESQISAKSGKVNDAAVNIQISKKKRRTNRLRMICNRCGFVKTFLQQPDYRMWIERAGAC